MGKVSVRDPQRTESDPASWTESGSIRLRDGSAAQGPSALPATPGPGRQLDAQPDRHTVCCFHAS